MNMFLLTIFRHTDGVVFRYSVLLHWLSWIAPHTWTYGVIYLPLVGRFVTGEPLA